MPPQLLYFSYQLALRASTWDKDPERCRFVCLKLTRIECGFTKLCARPPLPAGLAVSFWRDKYHVSLPKRSDQSPSAPICVGYQLHSCIPSTQITSANLLSKIPCYRELTLLWIFSIQVTR